MKYKNKKKLKVICIIPARGGSKGIKLKNLKKVCGRSLLSYPVKAAIKSRVCDKIFVSTDSKKIAYEAKKLGASVPFLRKKNFLGIESQLKRHFKTRCWKLKNIIKKNMIFVCFLLVQIFLEKHLGLKLLLMN